MIDDQKKKRMIGVNDKLVVSMTMMDAGQRLVADRAPVIAARHQPGYAFFSDADNAKRQTMIADANRKLSDRWKDPASLPVDLTPKPELEVRTVPATADAAYRSYDQKLSQRWKGAAA